METGRRWWPAAAINRSVSYTRIGGRRPTGTVSGAGVGAERDVDRPASLLSACTIP